MLHFVIFVVFALIISGQDVLASTCGQIGVSTTLDSNVSSTSTCFTINTSNIVLDCAGFSINYGDMPTNGAGVATTTTGQLTNITIKNCHIWNGSSSSGMQSYGIQFTNVENSTIINNTINISSPNTTTVIGIYITSFAGSSFGINITNNTVRSAERTGIEIDLNTDRILILNNTVITNDSAILIGGIGLNLVNNTNVTNNRAYSRFGKGISISGSRNVLINNTLESANLSGIFLANNNNAGGNQNNTFINNTIISQKDVALWIGQGNHNNTFIDTKLATNNTWIVIDTGGGISASNENNMTWTLFDEPNGSILIIPHITLNTTTDPGQNINISKQKLNVTFNNAFLNSTDGHTRPFNRSAQITLRNITFSTPHIQISFSDNNSWENCTAPTCTNLSYSGGVFIFNVSSFTTYRANETPNSSVVTVSVGISVVQLTKGNFSTNTPGSAQSANDSAQGGYTLELNLTVQSQTNQWQGYYGHVDGNITLVDETGALFYRWAWNTTNGSGLVFAAENATIVWVNINVGNAESLKYVGSGVNASTSANQTFKSLTNVTVGNTTLNDVPSTATYNATNESAFEMGIVRSGEDNFVFGRIYNDKNNFKGSTSDYQLMVPTPQSAQSTYFFFMELR